MVSLITGGFGLVILTAGSSGMAGLMAGGSDLTALVSVVNTGVVNITVGTN